MPGCHSNFAVLSKNTASSSGVSSSSAANPRLKGPMPIPIISCNLSVIIPLPLSKMHFCLIYPFLPVNMRCLSLLGFCQFFSTYIYRSEEHTSELQSRGHLVFRLLPETNKHAHITP